MLKQLHGLVTPPPRTIRYSLSLIAIILVAAAVAISLNLALAQSANGVYDTDGDRLIEINNIEQLDAVRYDPDGNGHPDSDAVAYNAAFPVNSGQLVCNRSCNGYELERSLDFSSADSYASGRVNSAWTSVAGWTPIDEFGATLEGNGRTISNLYMDGNLSDEDYTGLFGRISSSGAVVRNVGLLDAEVTGQSYVGALVGQSRATVSESYSTGRVTGTGNYIGGLVGQSYSTVTGSHSTASVLGAGSASDDVGGLVGWNDGGISGSYSTGAVTGRSHVGGLIGSTYQNGTISESYSNSDVTGSRNRIGGLVGQSGSTVNVSYATGTVSGGQYVGGLIGLSHGGSTNSVYATGAVSGAKLVGGLIGTESGQATDIRLTASYAVGSVSGTTDVGGLVGLAHVSVKIAHSYWDTEASGLTASAGGEGKTTVELQEPTGAEGIYAGWNPRSWDFGSRRHYPALRADLDGDGVATAAEFGGQGRTPGQAPPTPTMDPTGKYVDFSMGLGHICLLRDDGVVECSGDNSQGQTSPPEGGRYVKLDGGDNHTCGLMEDGEVECWGSVAGTFSKDNPPVPPTPTPTPTPGPTTGPPATVGPTPPGSDSCVETLSANGSVTGEWSSGCQSETEAQDDSGSYPFARYYSFTLAQESEVTITLELASGDADTYLYLREGDARSGDFLYENDDDGGTTRSEIVATLGAGSYTIEATTYEAGQTGTFTLTVSGL